MIKRSTEIFGRLVLKGLILVILSTYWHSCLASDTEPKPDQFLHLVAKFSRNLIDSSFLKNMSQQDFKKVCRHLQETPIIEKNEDYHIWVHTITSDSCDPDHPDHFTDSNKLSQKFIREEIDLPVDLMPEHYTVSNLFKTVTKDNYQQFIGLVQARFKGIDPIWSTGIALDKNYVLTLASNVTFGTRNSLALDFTIIKPSEPDNSQSIGIESVMYPASFHEFADDGDQYNFAVLKLTRPLDFLDNQTFLFHTFQSSDTRLMLPMVLHGFQNKDHHLKTCPIDTIGEPEKSRHLIKYKCDAVGCIGAPLLVERDNDYYITGLHMGSWRHQTDENQALSLNIDIQRRIRLIQYAEAQSLLHLRFQSSHRCWRKVKIDSMVCNLNVVPVLNDFVEAYPDNSNKSYLTLLWKKLHKLQSHTWLTRVTLAGMAGIDKTSLAAQHAREARQNNAYKVIYWIVAENEEKIAEGYRDLLKDFGVSSDHNIRLENLTSLVDNQLYKK